MVFKTHVLSGLAEDPRFKLGLVLDGWLFPLKGRLTTVFLRVPLNQFCGAEIVCLSRSRNFMGRLQLQP